MLKKVFAAPDPGLLRLRSAGRAVLGIGLAVVVCGVTGHGLAAVITGGLAALLALFTVTDTTVRDQAVSTALLPVVGLPVLVLAALLHDHPLSRAAAFVLVAGAAVYVRRWGPRGHALGVFAFMMFFVAQFLRLVPDGLGEVFSAVVLAVLVASVARFGVWCFERRQPPPARPAEPGGTGLARATTRQTFQMIVAGTLALAVGELLSPERSYWAIGAAWWVFVNTTSRGETLVRGFRRLLGTAAGVTIGLFVAIPVNAAPVPTAALVAACVFAIFYTAPVSYSWMMLAVTLMVTLLYGTVGVLEPVLLALRLTETGVGALSAALAVTVVLPVTTHATTNAWIERAVHGVHDCTNVAARRLAGAEDADPAVHVAELEATLGRVRLSLAPLMHPLSPLRARKARARRVLSLLDECLREVRGLMAVAADPHASHDARLTAACQRVEAAVQTLVAPGRRPSAGPSPVRASAAAHPTGADAALRHLGAVERGLAELAAPLSVPPRGLAGS